MLLTLAFASWTWVLDTFSALPGIPKNWSEFGASTLTTLRALNAGAIAARTYLTLQMFPLTTICSPSMSGNICLVP